MILPKICKSEKLNNFRLSPRYNDRKSGGTIWANTYAMSSAQEYFAEGVQSWFNVNAFSDPPNGVHNHVATKGDLETYDEQLYKIIKQVFPCENEFLKRCEDDLRTREVAQVLLMNCNEGDGVLENELEDNDDT